MRVASNRGLEEAIHLGQLTGARLRLLHVVDETAFALSADTYSGYTVDFLTLLREAGQDILAKAKAQVEAAGLVAETVIFDSLKGRVCDVVTDDAKFWPADLIVIGTHGRRGASRLFLGSDAEQTLRLATVPVLLVRSSDEPATA